MTRVFVAGRGYVQVPDGWDRWTFGIHVYRRTGDSVEVLSAGRWLEATATNAVAQPPKFVGESLGFWK